MSLDGTLAKTNNTVGKNTSKVFNNQDRKPSKLGSMTDSVSGIQKNVAGTAVGVGNIVAKVAGSFGVKMPWLTGQTKVKYKPTNESNFVGGLRGFYNHFSGASLDSVNKIDPFLTFECEFQFHPSVQGVKNVTKIETASEYNLAIQNEEGGMSEAKPTTETSETLVDGVNADSVINRLIKNIKFKNAHLNISYEDEENAKDKNFQQTEEISHDTDAEGNPIEIWTTKTVYNQEIPVITDMYVNLGIYIQNIILPNISINGEDEVTTLVGKFPVPGNLVIPDNNTFNMEIVNVEAPIQENIFYPWMRETTLPFWSYDNQPFTTATITVDLTEHSNVKYKFFGCRPTQIQLMQPNQAPNQNLTRNVTFTFDFMTIETIGVSSHKYKGLKGKKSSGDKSGNNSKSKIANAALFSATNSLRL